MWLLLSEGHLRRGKRRTNHQAITLLSIPDSLSLGNLLAEFQFRSPGSPISDLRPLVSNFISFPQIGPTSRRFTSNSSLHLMCTVVYFRTRRPKTRQALVSPRHTYRAGLEVTPRKRKKAKLGHKAGSRRRLQIRRRQLYFVSAGIPFCCPEHLSVILTLVAPHTSCQMTIGHRPFVDGFDVRLESWRRAHDNCCAM